MDDVNTGRVDTTLLKDAANGIADRHVTGNLAGSIFVRRSLLPVACHWIVDAPMNDEFPTAIEADQTQAQIMGLGTVGINDSDIVLFTIAMQLINRDWPGDALHRDGACRKLLTQPFEYFTCWIGCQVGGVAEALHTLHEQSDLILTTPPGSL